jgi:integrase
VSANVARSIEASQIIDRRDHQRWRCGIRSKRRRRTLKRWCVRKVTAVYDFVTIAPGIALGYRRNRAAGTWVVRVADGKGGNWTKRVSLADDFEDADGEHVLTWWQAIDKARKLARGTDDAGRPATVKEAVDAYERDLIARGGSVANAGRIRKHLTATLAAKPVGLLTVRELAHWRDSLLAASIKPATLVRLFRATKAALNLAARRDHRIANRNAWHDGLSGLAENFSSRNAQRLDDGQVGAVVAAAYAIDPAFGLYVEVAATTGARLSQIARLTVADLQADNGTPRLLMPTSRKGRNRKAGKRPVPITVGLANKLKSNRLADAPLLLRADGRPWQSSYDGDHLRLYSVAATRAGVEGSIYALRHSSIIRSLLANVPIRVVAATHDTGAAAIERTYSAYITEFSDAVSRPALLDLSRPAPTSNVVPHSRG